MHLITVDDIRMSMTYRVFVECQLTGETRSTELKTCLGAAVFIPLVTELARSVRGNRLATKCQRYVGTALPMRRTS